jgi:hypothetical protein
MEAAMTSASPGWPSDIAQPGAVGVAVKPKRDTAATLTAVGAAGAGIGGFLQGITGILFGGRQAAAQALTAEASIAQAQAIADAQAAQARQQMLYIGLGVGGLVLVGVLAVALSGGGESRRRNRRNRGR